MLISCLGMAGQQRYSLFLSNVSVQQAILALNRECGVSVAFASEDVDLEKKVSVNGKNVPLQAILDQIFAGQNVDILIEKNKVTVTRKEPATPKEKAKTGAHGFVRDAAGEPVVGAVVHIPGTNHAAITLPDGSWTLDGAAPGDMLEVSCMGYSTKTARVGKGSVVNFVLEDDAQLLEESVVVGFGVQKKENLTGAVSSISSKQLGNRPVISTANALQGLDPAVNLTMGTGSPESSYKVDIRGSVSINSGSPLILVDGVEMDLRAVNPNDIESISVLKDASASAIYGAKASAGVILVTTKAGESDDGDAKYPVINYSGRVSMAANTTSTDFITNGYDFVTFTNGFYNAFNGYDFYQYPSAGGELQKLLDRRNDAVENPARPWVTVGNDGKYYYYANTDWFGYLYNRTRPQHEHNISVRGGNDRFNYYFSGRYLAQKGIFRIYGDTFRDYSFRSKVGVKIRKNLKYSNNISFDRTAMSYPGAQDYQKTIAYLQNYLSPSFIPVNPDGTAVAYVNQTYSNSNLGSGYLAAITNNKAWNEKIVRTITISNQLDWDVFSDLRLTASYSLKMRDPLNRYRNNTYEYSRELDKTASYSQGTNVYNAYTENHYTQIQQNAEAYASYRHTFGEDHNFKATAGTQYTDYRYSTLGATQTDLSTERLATFAVASGEITLEQKINTYATIGFFGRVNYDYKGRYLLELSGRADASSRFAPGSRWGFFPSASAGWRVSEEPFFSPLKGWWNNLKIRASVGSLGNQQVSGYYTYIDQVSSDHEMAYTFDNKSIAYYSAVTAPIADNLTWETVTTYNLGLDMGFLRGRLTVGTDFYIRDTRNMLTSSITLPAVYGASSPKTNDADLRTTGFELMLSWNDSFMAGAREFRYGVTATLGDHTTVITRFNNPGKSLSDYYVGQRLGEIWGYHVDGLFATDEEAAAYQTAMDWDRSVSVYNKIFSAKGSGMSNLLAGDMKYADLDGDGAITRGENTATNPGDRMVIGNSLPRWSYSFRLDFAWAGFDLSAFFQGVGKRDWYPTVSSETGQQSVDFFGPYTWPMVSFISTDFPSNCWSVDNPDAYFPRQRGYIARADGPMGQVNDRYLQNAGYIRLKNLSLGYTMPLKGKFIDRLRVSFNGENLWYWSPMKKYCKTVDPELVFSSDTNNANTGVGYFYSKVFSFNLDITF